MPRGDPFYRKTELDAIKKIANDTQSHNGTEGIVVSVSASGTSVQLRGSSNYTPVEVVQNIKPRVNDRVLLRRSEQSNRWIIYGIYNVKDRQGDSSPITSSGGVSVTAPSDLSLSEYYNSLVVYWKPPAFHGEFVYEIEMADDSVETNSEIFTISGSTFIVYLNSDTTKYFRVRSLGPSWTRSGWTSWVYGTSVDPYNILKNIVVARGNVATANGEVWWNNG